MPIGDAAEKAFRKYARLGFDRREYSCIEISSRLRACCKTESEAIKLMAVYDTLRMLEASDRADTAQAVRAVYFSRRGRSPRKNDITYAVRRFAFECGMNERTAWRKIGEAKSLYNTLLKGQNVCS